MASKLWSPGHELEEAKSTTEEKEVEIVKEGKSESVEKEERKSEPVEDKELEKSKRVKAAERRRLR